MPLRALLPLFVLASLQAAEPLPPDLAQKLDLVRMLPASIGASRMMDVLERAPLDRENKAALAYEAYLMATGFGVEAPAAYAVRQRGGPLGWLLRASASVDAMHPMGAAMRAWKMYQDNFDAKAGRTLDFPARRIPKVESCRVATVDDPYDYYDAAIQAGPRIFGMVLPSARYAIDMGRLARAILVLPPPNRPLKPVMDLLLLLSSDRQFAYAMEFTPLHVSLLRLAREGSAESAKLLMERYATFLEKHWAQRRCSGNEWISYRGIVEEFNAEASSLETKFVDLRFPRLKANAWWAQALDPDSYAEREEDVWNLLLLRLKIDGSALDGVNATSVLREVEEFRPPDKLSAFQRLLQKHFAYHELRLKFRNTEWEKSVVTSWLGLVAGGRLTREAPLVWWAVLRDLKDWAGTNPDRRAFLEASGDTAMRSWLRLEALDDK